MKIMIKRVHSYKMHMEGVTENLLPDNTKTTIYTYKVKYQSLDYKYYAIRFLYHTQRVIR